MISRPTLDSRKKDGFVSERIKQRYLALPGGVSWVLFPILAVLSAFVTMESLELDGSLARVSAPLAGLIAGLFAASFIEQRIPGWNRSRRRDIASRASAEFQQLFETHAFAFQRIASDSGRRSTTWPIRLLRFAIECFPIPGICRSGSN